MVTRVGRSYEYNVLCPVCGFKKKNFEMLQRWDGIMVCKEDWEPRHISEFFQTRQDAHLLPYIYPDNDGTNVGVINRSTLTEPYPGAGLGVIDESAVVGVGVVGTMVVGDP